MTADFLRMLATLLVLCGIIIVAGYLVRRLGSKSPLLAGPSLGQVLGRVHLSPKASLQFVRVADRVLIVGLTPTAMTLITEMDAEHFEPAPVPARRSFMEELQATSATLDAPRASDDQELTALRGDIKRLQQYLQEAVRDQP